MKKIIILLLASLLLYSCSQTMFRNELEFGNKLAQAGLWKEAYYRWQKYLQSGHESAAVHNNIAIALEQMGKFKEAEKAYQRALKLEPKNTTISGNYQKLKNYLGAKDKKNEK